MAGTMSEADLVADLKESLQDAAAVFDAANDADLKRHLAAAAMDMGAKRPRTLLGEVTLVAEQFNYTAPADLLSYKSDLWGVPARRIQPWEKTYPGRLPDVQVAVNGAVRELHFLPAPTSFQIGVLGSAFKFYYFAAHAIGATAAATTILPGDRGLLLLRAQAEAMKEMAMRNIGKPVTMRDGMSSGTRNGTPSFLFETLMKLFEVAT
jgi:hypothetical protein